MASTPELVLVVQLSPSDLATAVPVPLQPLDPFAEPEPSRGATVQLHSGRYVVLIYGDVTNRLSVHAGSDATTAVADFLQEAKIPRAAIVWERSATLMHASAGTA
jgi:hypothetical protein